MTLVGIGIDSGGTHTTLAIKYADNSRRSEVDQSLKTLSDAQSAETIQETADWIVTRILDLTQEGDECCVWIGAAVAVMTTTVNSLTQAFRNSLNELSAREINCSIFIANDAVSILKAAPLHGAGIVSVIGTGSIVVGAHPAYPNGITRRGGYEWPIGDQGAGVWMTVEAIKLALTEVQKSRVEMPRSELLNRLLDYFGIDPASFSSIPYPHSSLAAVDTLASVLASISQNRKRQIAGFVYPNLFQLADSSSPTNHDPLAERVISESVRIIKNDIAAVSEDLNASISSNLAYPERLPLVTAGSIAANPIYHRLLVLSIDRISDVQLIEVVTGSAQKFADIAIRYLLSSTDGRKTITGSFDPLHQVLKIRLSLPMKQRRHVHHEEHFVTIFGANYITRNVKSPKSQP